MQLLKALGFGLYLVVATFLGIMFYFADSGPGETPAIRFLVTIVYFLIACGLIGLLAPKRWGASAVIAGLPLLIGITTINTNFGFWQSEGTLAYNIALIIIPPVLGVLGSYFAAKRKLAR